MTPEGSGTRPGTGPGSELDVTITVVAFTVPERRLSEMDIGTGPCVRLRGRRRPLTSPLNQDLGETPELSASLHTALTGRPAAAALRVVGRSGPGRLSVAGTDFRAAMRAANEELVGAIGEDLTDFEGIRDRLDRAWMSCGDWPASVVGTGDRLTRMAWARIAEEKGQQLYFWHGPSVPMLQVGSGSL